MPTGASASVRVGETLELVTPPTGYGDAAYTTTTGTICSVDTATGVITALAVGDCTVRVAFAGDDNYQQLAAGDLQTVTVAMGGQIITISQPYGAEPDAGFGRLVGAGQSTYGDGRGAAWRGVGLSKEEWDRVGYLQYRRRRNHHHQGSRRKSNFGFLPGGSASGGGVPQLGRQRVGGGGGDSGGEGQFCRDQLDSWCSPYGSRGRIDLGAGG